MVKELVPIVLACTVWGPRLARKTVLVWCDNTGVVAAVQKWTSKDQSATETTEGEEEPHSPKSLTRLSGGSCEVVQLELLEEG